MLGIILEEVEDVSARAPQLLVESTPWLIGPGRGVKKWSSILD